MLNDSTTAFIKQSIAKSEEAVLYSLKYKEADILIDVIAAGIYGRGHAYAITTIIDTDSFATIEHNAAVCI